VRRDRAEAALASAGLTLDEVPELGLPPGTAIPSFAATAVTGEEISPQTLGATGTPALLLFTSPHCGPCATLMPAVAAWQQEHVERLSIVLASSGSEDDVREEATRHGLTHVLHDRDHELYERFQANGTPSAVLLSPDGTIASWVASGADWIEQLVEHIVAEPERGGLPIGADAPALELPSLAGEKVSLASLRGREALLLFWNPDCGFCRALRDDVLTWEASADGDTPRLVIVSSGDAERTRADGFRSLVLLDEGFAAGAAFDAKGTPMAVLLDAEGRVASPVAAGADQVRSTVVELAAPRR
jgi:thiol-disulfide isomerase/thioredoxin